MQALISAATLLFFTGTVHGFPPLVERATTSACSKDNLYNAFTNPTRSVEASSFCSAYISVPLTTTTTTYPATCSLYTYGYATATIHPLYLYNLQQQTYSSTLSYNSADPTPILVPGKPQDFYGPPVQPKKRSPGSVDEIPGMADDSVGTENEASWNVPDVPMITPSPTVPRLIQEELLRRASSSVPLPTWLATTYPPSRISSACSCISPSAAYTSTYTRNDYTQITTATCTTWSPLPVATYPAFCAPSFQVNAPQPSTHANWKVTPNFNVPSKLDCCAACAQAFNCVWWKFDFGTAGDGWKPGQCHYAYYTGTYVQIGDLGAPAVCPNGQMFGIDLQYHNSGRQDSNNKPGYNAGQCGFALNVYESSQDSGYPDNDYYHDHDCGLLTQPYYDGPCN